jgi:prevent-host-death family protein
MARPKTPEIETMNVSEARRQFSDVLNRVYRNRERIVVEKNGIPMAGIVPIADLTYARNREEGRQGLRDILNQTRSAFVEVPEDEIEREIEKAIAEVDAERKLARRIVAAISRVAPDAFEASDESLESTIQDLLADEARKRAAEPANSVGE